MRLSGLTLLLALTRLAVAAAEDEQSTRLSSPDKKWEYKVVDDAPVIVKAGSSDAAVELPGKPGEVIWARDSRRFAFSYRAGVRYGTCVAFELIGSSWKQLPDLEENAEAVQEIIKRAKFAQVKKLGLSPTTSQRRINDSWRARRWLDDDTLELSAYSESVVYKGKEDEEIESVSCGVLFRIRCDNRGGWKVISTRVVSGEEREKLQ
jgi:hypothetical protein